jgi:hypothetical protein
LIGQYLEKRERYWQENVRTKEIEIERTIFGKKREILTGKCSNERERN